MATGSSVERGLEAEWQHIKEEITCSICGDIFIDPKTIIPCLHTFCKRCLECSIETNKRMVAAVCCPLCRAPLSQDEIASIPSNFTIGRLVEIFVNRQNEEDVLVTIGQLVKSFGLQQKAGRATSDVAKCGNCEENLPLVVWCMECEGPLCHDCNELHKKIKAYRAHEVVPINQFLGNDPNQVFKLATSEKVESCKKHRTLILDQFCKTCDMLICQECALQGHPHGHRDHIVSSVENVLDEKQKRIKKILVPLKELHKQIKNGISKIEHCEKQIDQESEANIKKIQATFDKQYKILKEQEKAAVEKVNNIKALFKKTLASQKENAKKTESQLASCNEFYDKVLTVNRTRELIMYSDWIENKVTELNEQMERTSLDPVCKPSHMIIKCKPVVDDLLCDVSSVPICSVTRGPVVINRHIKFTIALKDVFESPMIDQSKNIEIHCNKEKKFVHNKHIEKQSEGQYEIKYMPKRMECHSLSIYWRGIALNHEKIRVLVNIRDYSNIKQEVKVIKDYGPIKYIADCPPMNKHIGRPYSLARGPHNELLVRDVALDVLVVFDEHFQYSHVIGGSGMGYGRFSCMTGVAANKKGHVYIADRDLHCIQKLQLKKGGKFICQFGHKGTAGGEFNCPCGLLLSQSGLLFVCDLDNYRIQVFKNEQFSYCFGERGTGPGSFDQPSDLTMNNSEDQLFITDINNHRIQLFTPKGQFLKVFSNAIGVPINVPRPSGVHYTPDGHLLISGGVTNSVSVFQEDGKFISSIKGFYQGERRFIGPCGIMMTNNGQIIITSFQSNRLFIF